MVEAAGLPEGERQSHFRVKTKDGLARNGELVTAHGTVETPVFCPVASQASVKAVTSEEVKGLELRMILANTYHLYLQPGLDVIEKMGGLHKFMGWQGPILTDSGGYQVFSLSPLRRVDDDGVTFRSHIDGSEHRFSPESAVKYQEILGSDIMMALDECPPHDGTRREVELATDRTARWAERCLKAWTTHDRKLYAIVQGGSFGDLRRDSARRLVEMNFPGYAIGGLSLGETKSLMLEMIDTAVAYLPEDRPRYLMGVGSPEDIVEGVARGIDIFDCALPTRVARNGALFTYRGRVNIRNAEFRDVAGPLEPGCDCYACRTYSTAYLRHLFLTRELLFYRLATLHNLRFISRLMQRIRDAISAGSFSDLRREFMSSYRSTDERARIEQKEKWLRKQRSV